MKWNLKSPERGDIVRIKTGNIYHYGIFVSNSEIIQFGLAPIARPGVPDCDIEVCASDIITFACGNRVEVGECENPTEASKRRTPEQTVKSAREGLGQKGYNLIHNNCEHFAYLCAMGERYCSQTMNVRELFKNFPIVDIYVTTEKDSDTESALVQYAINRSFGKKPNDAALEYSGGVWSSSICKIKTAKHDGLVAVCVSRGEIELMLSPSSASPDTADNGVWTKSSETDGICYTVAVKTATVQRVRFYNNVSI